MGAKRLGRVKITDEVIEAMLGLPVGHSIVSVDRDFDTCTTNLTIEGHTYSPHAQGYHIAIDTNATKRLSECVLVNIATVKRLQKALDEGELHKYLTSDFKGTDLEELTAVIGATNNATF